MAFFTTKRPVFLVVEDEPLLRLAAVDMIEDAGYEVLEAADADKAIAILELRPDVHTVFSDIQMPGSMDGLKLVAYVRNRWPPIKLVTTSGQIAVVAGDLPEGAVFIGKPYTSAEVSAVLLSLRDTA